MANFRRYFIGNSLIFITMVTNNRVQLLVDNIDQFRTSIKSANYKFKVIAGVVLPDHCHLILAAENTDDYPKIIKSIKYTFSKNISYVKSNMTISEQMRGDRGVWQRRYYDHIIRNEEDFRRHLDYIHYNPYKHLMVKPCDWKFSSFKKFVDLGYYENNWFSCENDLDLD